MSFQHDIIDSKLLEQAIRTGDPRQGAAAGDEEAFVSIAGATASAEVSADNHHRRLDSIHCLEADDAVDESTHPDAQLDRRTSSIRRGERRILATVRPEEPAMMTNVQLADPAAELTSQN